jgi:hypothetical protein
VTLKSTAGFTFQFLVQRKSLLQPAPGRDFPSTPFGRPGSRPLARADANPSRVLGDQVSLDLGDIAAGNTFTTAELYPYVLAALQMSADQYSGC